jgi:DNA-3-methyladenine glycosylase
MPRLPRRFYHRDPRDLAPDLLNKILVHGTRRARIVEVEAYCGAEDPGSHTFRGRTARNATMFGRPGLLYVYFSYGMHFCCNVVCGDEDVGVAVLLRAAAPLRGLDEMRAARGPAARRTGDLCSGPGKLCQAFGIDRSHDGADLVRADKGVVLVDDGIAPPRRPGASTRIGLSAGRGDDLVWRFTVSGDPNLSRP